MRVNVYSQELTSEVQVTTKTAADTGLSYHAIRFMLESSPHLHHLPNDDDRSAITFWLPTSGVRREMLADVFERAAHYVRQLPTL